MKNFTNMKVPQKYQHMLEEIDHEGFEGYWAYTKPGFMTTSTDSHTLHEYTQKEMLKVIRELKPCDCEQCQERLAAEEAEEEAVEVEEAPEEEAAEEEVAAEPSEPVITITPKAKGKKREYKIEYAGEVMTRTTAREYGFVVLCDKTGNGERVWFDAAYSGTYQNAQKTINTMKKRGFGDANFKLVELVESK